MSNLVTFEQAKQLKELDYNRDSFHAYSNDGQLESSFEMTGEFTFDQEDMNNAAENGYLNCCLAPTVSEALDWVREEKKDARIKFYVECTYSFELKDAAYTGIITSNSAVIIWERTEEYSTHPLASSALLDAVLTYLEQKEKK